MSTLSSTSTDAQVVASYDDNASYAEDNSVAKARALVTACRILVRRRPTTISTNGRNVAFDVKLVQDELARALAWLDLHSDAAQDGGPRVTRADFRDYRT